MNDDNIHVPRQPPTKAELKEMHELEREATLARQKKLKTRIKGRKTGKWPRFAGGLRTIPSTKKKLRRKKKPKA